LFYASLNKRIKESLGGVSNEVTGGSAKAAALLLEIYSLALRY